MLSTGQISALALLAVLVFWVLGAYNRLVAQRNAAADAWARVNDALRQRGAAVPPLLAALREPLAAEQGALQALADAHGAATQAADGMASAPLLAPRAQAWVAAEAALAAAASRVLALLEQHPALCARADVAPLLTLWRESQARLPFARQLFNDVAGSYNAAVAMFPTRLLARAFRFAPAGLL